MRWNNILPNNTNHNLSAYQQHFPLLSLKNVGYVQSIVLYRKNNLKNKQILT